MTVRMGYDFAMTVGDDSSEATPLGRGRDNKNDIRVERRKDNRRDLHSICCLVHSCTYRAAFFSQRRLRR